MGIGGSKLKIPKQKKELYYFKNFKTYNDDSYEKHKVKLEVRLKNIIEYKSIQIQLIYYQDSKKNIQQ